MDLKWPWALSAKSTNFLLFEYSVKSNLLETFAFSLNPSFQGRELKRQV